MSMSTVLRVKRRLEESPQDALVLMCKRVKTNNEEISPSLFVFRGTVDNQETVHVKELLPKTDIKLQTIPNVDSIIKKIRKERKDVSTESRYEIVNCYRGIKDEDDDESDDILNLIDLQKTRDKDGDVQYAYDVYTSWKQDFDISMIDNFVGVETDLVFDAYRDPRQDPSDNEDEDDDSNDENNWRNEYPDSEPSSIDEEDMIRAMERVDIEDDLSSDTGEDKIYDDPPDIFQEDVKRYGEAYAKYKARVMSENPHLSNNQSLIQYSRVQADEGYKDDSDDGFYYGEDEDTDQFKEQYRDDSS
ncbi:unnamed protein product [Arctia plantaginis]|uniref:Probable RNA polymerase II nuclear localization protein SLC7A6OS n=1 Tax=Arctia plantaginis TaxID=874455 RepID=A0A8S0ZDJ9_ARCPL|nr:unnamed protein product [Arctia plantaginis]CAB3248168.1 unnamed protein product [Arctia plantaginis]